ncbi:hypothetical protein QBC36DRAFT_100222 [Triangularia setosa]|uniref:Uncharacterized protein n=1 Tax=Triangularia setosa TaxID=2587417 RepID=A0AAN6VXK8_9PEZI|nr:hypothetical protein QBC36DRAFT_100222 [Podospora setosa]
MHAFSSLFRLLRLLEFSTAFYVAPSIPTFSFLVFAIQTRIVPRMTIYNNAFFLFGFFSFWFPCDGGTGGCLFIPLRKTIPYHAVFHPSYHIMLLFAWMRGWHGITEGGADERPKVVVWRNRARPRYRNDHPSVWLCDGWNECTCLMVASKNEESCFFLVGLRLLFDEEPPWVLEAMTKMEERGKDERGGEAKRQKTALASDMK